MTDGDKLTLSEAASIIRAESRNYYDEYKRWVEFDSRSAAEKSRTAYEKFKELDKIAKEIDIIVSGL